MSNNITPEATALTASTFGVNQLKPGALQVTVDYTVKPKDLYAIVDSVLDLHGCRACGIAGLDINIRPQDPRFQKNFEHISGVKDVVFTR